MYDPSALENTLAELGLVNQPAANEDSPVVTAMGSVSYRRVSEDDLEDMEPELFTFSQLTTEAKQPRFKRGDKIWVPDYDEQGEILDYVEAFVVGLEIYPDEVMYMLGFFDPSDNMIDTNFESVTDDEAFAERPDLEQARKRAQGKPKLSVVS